MKTLVAISLISIFAFNMASGAQNAKELMQDKEAEQALIQHCVDTTNTRRNQKLCT